MRASSILVESIDGRIYKITDLIKGKKVPLTESDLKSYDMHAQSGVYKDLDGSLIDIAEFYASKNNIEFADIIPDEPKPNALYIDKNEKTISVFDEEIGDFIILGNGGEGGSLSQENSLTEDEITQVVTMFQSVKINK